MASQDVAIRERAYAIWEEEGRPHGREWEHWYQAVKEIAGPTPGGKNAARAAPKAKVRKTTTKGRLRQALKSAVS